MEIIFGEKLYLDGATLATPPDLDGESDGPLHSRLRVPRVRIGDG